MTNLVGRRIGILDYICQLTSVISESRRKNKDDQGIERYQARDIGHLIRYQPNGIFENRKERIRYIIDEIITDSGTIGSKGRGYPDLGSYGHIQ